MVVYLNSLIHVFTYFEQLFGTVLENIQVYYLRRVGMNNSAMQTLTLILYILSEWPSVSSDHSVSPATGNIITQHNLPLGRAVSFPVNGVI